MQHYGAAITFRLSGTCNASAVWLLFKSGAVKFRLVDAAEILSLIEIRPPGLHLVFTGRNALPELIDAADLVTKMKLVKCPFQKGITAQTGIEF